ncbi:MAG: molybdopterin-dependent oxidoreductase [bacterium]|nr:molybdopterin-dependent oxidoreductase [bacterium]
MRANLLLVFLVVFLLGCAQNTVQRDQQPLELKGVEVKEYQGEKLSSVNDFRENSIKGPQHIDKESYMLNVKGLVETPKEYTYDEVLGFQSYEKVVTLDCVEGWSATILWEGILLRELLAETGVSDEAKVIIFRAYDNYSTSYPVEYVMENDIILAYKMNGVELPPERGFPFQVVAESKWGYKWAKWITEIELSDDLEYEGYWESRGYSNSGNLDEKFFGNEH